VFPHKVKFRIDFIYRQVDRMIELAQSNEDTNVSRHAFQPVRRPAGIISIFISCECLLYSPPSLLLFFCISLPPLSLSLSLFLSFSLSVDERTKLFALGFSIRDRPERRIDCGVSFLIKSRFQKRECVWSRVSVPFSDPAFIICRVWEGDQDVCLDPGTIR